MFYFIACIASTAGGVNCTAPVTLKDFEMCKALEEVYRGAAQEIYKSVVVTSRCVSAETPAKPSGVPPISIPEIRLP
jgi:hypothetical protein